MTDQFDRLARDLETFSAETTSRMLRRGRHDVPGGPSVTVPGPISDLVNQDPEEDGVAMTNPMEDSGDLIVGGESGGAIRLAIGDDGQVLTVVSGELAWAEPSGLLDALMLGGM